MCVWGGGGGGGGGGQERGGIPTKKKYNRYSLIFVLMLYIKFQVPGSSGSLVLTQRNGVTDSSSSNSLHILLTRFFYCYKS